MYIEPDPNNDNKGVGYSRGMTLDELTKLDDYGLERSVTQVNV